MGVNAVMSRKMLQDVTCESAVCEASVEERGGQLGRGGRWRQDAGATVTATYYRQSRKRGLSQKQRALHR